MHSVDFVEVVVETAVAVVAAVTVEAAVKVSIIVLLPAVQLTFLDLNDGSGHTLPLGTRLRRLPRAHDAEIKACRLQASRKSASKMCHRASESSKSESRLKYGEGSLSQLAFLQCGVRDKASLFHNILVSVLKYSSPSGHPQCTDI